MKRKPYAKLKELIEGSIENGYSPKPVNKETGRWVLGLGALTPKGLNLSEKKSIALDDTKFPNRLLNEGDFLVSRSNTREKVGQASLYKGGLSNCIYPDLMMRFRINKSLATIDYIDHYLRSPIAQNYFASRAAGSNLSMVKITKSILAELLIYNPSLQEQKAIAAILSAWDEAIEKTERLIRLKKFSFQELLSSRIFRQSFKTQKLGKTIQEISQRNQTGISRVLSVTNHSGFVLPENQFERRVASQNLENYKVICKGQYAYNPSRINVGSIARLDQWDIGILSPMYVVFEIDETAIHSDFLYYWLQTKEARKRICASTQGSVRESVSFNDFANLIVPLPELKIQQEIIYELSLIEAELNNLSKIKEKLLLQKQGLMQKLLTGKWRVNFKEEKQ